jgi:hypothetical protein
MNSGVITSEANLSITSALMFNSMTITANNVLLDVRDIIHNLNCGKISAKIAIQSLADSKHLINEGCITAEKILRFAAKVITETLF